jgi:hypothetical protein
VGNFLATHAEFRAGRPPLLLCPTDGGDGFFACEILRDAE